MKLFLNALLPAISIISVEAARLECDMSQYHAMPGLSATLDGEKVTVAWEGASRQKLRANFAIEGGKPLIRELAISKNGRWVVLGENLSAEFLVTSGIRRTGHGLPEENRWDVYWDAPLSIPGADSGNPNLPRKPEEMRHAQASFQSSKCWIKTDGARLEISFDGLSMGLFSGRLQFTVYRGANLLRQEAIAKTDEPSVAYKYEAALNGFSSNLFPETIWLDSTGKWQRSSLSHSDGNQAVLRARNRLTVIEGKQGALAVFPPPHQFFFPRQLEVNLGYVWFRTSATEKFALGIRQGDNHEGYNPAWIERVFPLYNAPPRTWQRMAVYFYLSPESAEQCRREALAFTHGDHYKPLPGYKTMATHFHLAFTMDLLKSESLDTVPPWIPAMRGMGINIAHIFDFHGDGHPTDPGPLRLSELEKYFESCRRHSDADFLILPGEEANAHLGGHYNIMFPKPVYWTHARAKNQPLAENDPKYGRVYHTGSAADVYELMQRENALVWQTHPRTKGSTGYPDKIRDTDYFQSDHWLGTAFKALPADLSHKRLGEIRCFGTLDDMNNWGRPKYMVGEVDTYKKFADYDLYGDFNINYVKVDPLPKFDDWSAINRALRAGEFFVTTGEILIKNCSLESAGAQRRMVADVEWTFPLEFIELVWGDGKQIGRQLISATDRPPFGAERFQISFDPAGKKWVRFAVWDSACNGAFGQPMHLQSVR